MKYGNYDAIEVPYTECIPSDYDGVMGVPITFLDFYNPDQFDILGLTIGTLFDGNPLQMKVNSESYKHNCQWVQWPLYFSKYYPYFDWKRKNDNKDHLI